MSSKRRDSRFGRNNSALFGRKDGVTTERDPERTLGTNRELGEVRRRVEILHEKRELATLLDDWMG